jgi:hypothetical protein
MPLSLIAPANYPVAFPHGKMPHSSISFVYGFLQWSNVSDVNSAFD